MQIFGRNRARRVVRDLYRAILGREPDLEGARAYEELIREIGPERAIPRMLEAFHRSAEYRARADSLAVSYINGRLASQGNELINGRPVAHLASLGSYCLPALIFRDNGLRRYSLPFDWIFSTPPMVRDCLANDFGLFLDRRYYRSLSHGRKEPGADHQLYREHYNVPSLFAHRDPTRETDYLYFTRCVARFRQLMRSEDTKLFLVIGRPNHDLVNEFTLLLESLTRSTTNFVLLGVELLDPTEPGLTTLVPLVRLGQHGLYRFTPSSYNAEGGFLPDKIDEWTILRLIYRYKLELKDSLGSESSAPQSPLHAIESSSDCDEQEQSLPSTLT